MATNILVVEDCRTVQNCIQLVLTGAVDGLSIEFATSVASAKAKLDSGAYNAMILDLLLDDSDNAVETLKSLAEYMHVIPTIVVTGHNEITIGLDALRSGAKQFIAKPFDADELISAVKDIHAADGMSREHVRCLKLAIEQIRTICTAIDASKVT